MTEQTPGEMPTTPAAEKVAEPTPEQKPATLEELQAQMATMQKALKDANREAADRRKRLEAYEEAERKRQEAELTETEKLKKQLAERETELTRLTLDNLKRTIAAKVGIPEGLASRLQGNDAESIEADAKQLFETLPKPPKGPGIPPTNIGAGAMTGETEAQRRARIYSPGGALFDEEWGAKHGGGVFEITKGD